MRGLDPTMPGICDRGPQGNASSPKALLRRDLTRQLARRAWGLVEAEGQAGDL